MIRATLAACLFILTALGAASAHAQGPLADEARQVAFQSLADSQWVRLAGLGTGRFEGRLLDRGPAELVLSSESQPIRVPATSVDTVWTRGTSVKTGALVGALLGVGLGVALAVAACGQEHDCSERDGALILGAMGLGGGALVGAGVGLALPKWHRRYP
jgi:hypothetical protein